MIIKGYIITLIGIAILSILIEVLLPNGKMQKFVKAMFNLIILSAIILPIVNLIKSDFNLNSLFKNTEIKVDYDFIEATNKKMYTQIENSIKTDCQNIGYSNVDVKIEIDTNQNSVLIKQVSVDISNLKINIRVPHFEVKTDILEVIRKYINIENLNIIFIE